MGWFSKDGVLAKTFGPLPVTGYWVAVGQAIAGNKVRTTLLSRTFSTDQSLPHYDTYTTLTFTPPVQEEAKLAAIQCTKSTLTVAGGMLGSLGGPGGSAVGALAGGAAGSLLENAVANTVAPSVRGDLGQASFASAALAVAAGAAGAGAAGMSSEYVKPESASVVAPAMEAAGAILSAQAASYLLLVEEYVVRRSCMLNTR